MEKLNSSCLLCAKVLPQPFTPPPFNADVISIIYDLFNLESIHENGSYDLKRVDLRNVSEVTNLCSSCSVQLLQMRNFRSQIQVLQLELSESENKIYQAVQKSTSRSKITNSERSVIVWRRLKKRLSQREDQSGSVVRRLSSDSSQGFDDFEDDAEYAEFPEQLNGIVYKSAGGMKLRDGSVKTTKRVDWKPKESKFSVSSGFSGLTPRKTQRLSNTRITVDDLKPCAVHLEHLELGESTSRNFCWRDRMKEEYIIRGEINEGKFRCRIPGCHKTFFSEGPLHFHVRKVHEKLKYPFDCFLCETIEFDTWDKLRQHQNEKHSAKREVPVNCDKCEGTFLSAQGLLLHLTRQGGICKRNSKILTKTIDRKSNMIQKQPTPNSHQIISTPNRHSSWRDRQREMYVITGENNHADGKHECTIRNCGKTFFTPAPLHFHIRKFHEGLENPFDCAVCKLEFDSWFKLRNHQRVEHPDPNTIKCLICGETFKTYHKLLQHTSKEDKCGNTSDKGRSTPEKYVTVSVPTETETSIANDTTSTERESIENDTPSDWKRRQREKYIVEGELNSACGKYKCIVRGCARTFYTAVPLEFHVRKVHSKLQKPFNCSLDPQCNMVYETWNKLLHHQMQAHSGRADGTSKERVTSHFVSNKWSPSDGEVKVFNWRDRLRESYVVTGEIDSVEGKYNCTDSGCTKTFYTQAPLRFHVRKVHENLAEPFDCVICKIGFKTWQELQLHQKEKHLQKKEQSVTCDGCKRHFNSHLVLLMHLNKQGGNCMISYKTVGNVNVATTTSSTEDKHTERQDSEEISNIKCTVCKRSFSSNIQCRFHIRKVHENRKKPFDCVQCGAEFKKFGVWKRHNKNHFIRKRIPLLRKCCRCGKKFTYANWKIHIWKRAEKCKRPAVTKLEVKHRRKRAVSKKSKLIK